MGIDLAFFYVFAAVAVVASLLVVGQRSPLYSVMLLIASFVGLAGLYVLLGSPFVAVIQIIIYAGAILVLFLFVVMLLNAPTEPEPLRRRVTAGPRRAGAVLGAALGAELIWALWRTPMTREAVGAGTPGSVESVRTIGQVLFTRYAFAFEVTSVLIVVAMVGAVVLAKRRV